MVVQRILGLFSIPGLKTPEHPDKFIAGPPTSSLLLGGKEYTWGTYEILGKATKKYSFE